jgi:magnesium transporter
VRHTRVYRDGTLHDEGFPVADVSEHIADPESTVWFDLCEPTPEDFKVIREELGLHELAVEDALDPGQRPKLDRYDSHLFITAYALRLDAASGDLATTEVALFVTKNALVTVRNDESFDIDAVMSRWDDTRSLAGSGVSYLLHGLLDYVVDTHFEAVQELDTEIEKLEDQLFSETNSDAEMQRRNYQLRKSLVTARRYVLPMREVVNSLLRRDLHVVDNEMMPYYQDVYDHVLRAIEWTESLRDLVTNLLETRLTVRSNRLNVIMKQVTSWAAIIAIPTAVTGFYGQNVPFPGFGHVAGFWTSTAVIIVASVSLYFVFRRRDWL